MITGDEILVMTAGDGNKEARITQQTTMGFITIIHHHYSSPSLITIFHHWWNSQIMGAL